MSCASTKFQAFSVFFGPHAKPHGVIGLIKHYYLRLDPKLGHVKCAIIHIPCPYIACTNMLDKPWVIGSDPIRKLCYQPAED